MHFLTALFAMFFSFGHATAAPKPAVNFADFDTPATMANIPSRHELAQAEMRTSYAETACVSCRRMTATYFVR